MNNSTTRAADIVVTSIATPHTVHDAFGHERVMNNINRTDANIVATSVATPQAFAEVFERHYVSIARYLAGRIDETRAEDLAAGTFEKAFEIRHRFEPSQGDVRAWLFGIASNLLRHERRHERRFLRAVARLSAEAPTSDSSGEQLLGIVIAREQRPALAAALLKLDPRDREVMCLAAWTDLTMDQIGCALQVPPGTVRSRLNRARRQMGQSLTVAPSSPRTPGELFPTDTTIGDSR